MNRREEQPDKKSRFFAGAMRNSQTVTHIGIYAGTFDPIHNGHLAFARSALENGIDRVMFLVEPRPRRKQGVKAQEHRNAMVSIAIKDEPMFGSIVLEQARFTPLGTLPILLKRFQGNRLVMMFGDDVISHMVDHMADWPHIEKLAENSNLLIAARKHDQPRIIDMLAMLKNKYKLPFVYKFVEPKANDISSSKIRSDLKKGKKPSDIPKLVQNYIIQNKLYSSDDNIS